MQKHNKNFEVKIINEEKNSRIKTKTFRENSEKKMQVVHLLHCSYLCALWLQTISE